MRFTDKVAVITAFANGIGRATAEIMAREGAVVVGVDNHRDRLDEAVAALRGAGGKAHGRLCDALDPGQVEATVALVEQEFGVYEQQVTETYDVHLDAELGDSCTCKGHLRWGHRTVCKHIASVRELIARGELAGPPPAAPAAPSPDAA